MTEIEKGNILRLLLQHPDLKNSSASKLNIYLSPYDIHISFQTIEKYRCLLINKKNKYYNNTVFKDESYEPIIKEIVEELSKNKRKVFGNEIPRKNIKNELLKYKHKYINQLLKNENNISKQNKILKEIKEKTCLKFNYIPPKTLNYLYNDEAKKSGLLPKRSTVTPDLINKIENLFKDGTIPNYILDNIHTNKSVVQMIQDYIEANYKMKISRSTIQRYFHEYFEGLILKVMYERMIKSL